MEIAASVVAFAGISGQILQGCNYLSTFFSDVGDAPDVLVAISSELSTLRGRLEGFHMLLRDMQDRLPPELILQQNPAAALQKCQDAILKLQKFVDKYAALSMTTGGTPAALKSERHGTKSPWHGNLKSSDTIDHNWKQQKPPCWGDKRTFSMHFSFNI